MKKVKLLIFLLSVILMTSSMASCSQSKENAVEGNGKDVVNIGFSGPLSGAAAYYGEATLNGLEMAAEEINKEGFEIDGKTYEINLVSLDDEYLPNETAANAKRFIQEYNTPIIFTPHSGGISALQIFNEQENFLIGAYSSEPVITEGGNSLTVRIPPSYDGYVEPFSDYSMERFGKKIASLPPVTEYGKDWEEALLPYWEESGGEVVYNSSIDFSKDTDFFTIITNALKEDPDVLFIGGPSEPTAKVAKQARELGFEGGFIIMDQAKLDEMKTVTESYDLLEGAVGVVPLVDADYPAAPEFVEKYNEKFDKDPGSEAGLNYITLYIFVEAMKAAGNVEDAEVIREHIQDGLDNLPDDKKVYDIPGIDESGGFEANIHVAAVKDGKIIHVEVE